MAYKIYVTDALKNISENTAKCAALASGGSYISTRYADMLKPQAIDVRTGDEIAADVIKKAGLVVK